MHSKKLDYNPNKYSYDRGGSVRVAGNSKLLYTDNKTFQTTVLGRLSVKDGQKILFVSPFAKVFIGDWDSVSKITNDWAKKNGYTIMKENFSDSYAGGGNVLIVKTKKGLKTMKDFEDFSKDEIKEWGTERGFKYNAEGEKFGGQALKIDEFFVKPRSRYNVQLPSSSYAGGGDIDELEDELSKAVEELANQKRSDKDPDSPFIISLERKIKDLEEELSYHYEEDKYAGGGYVSGQMFEDEYSNLTLLDRDKYDKDYWIARRTSKGESERVIGEVEVSESQLDKMKRVQPKYAGGGMFGLGTDMMSKANVDASDVYDYLLDKYDEGITFQNEDEVLESINKRYATGRVYDFSKKSVKAGYEAFKKDIPNSKEMKKMQNGGQLDSVSDMLPQSEPQGIIQPMNIMETVQPMYAGGGGVEEVIKVYPKDNPRDTTSRQYSWVNLGESNNEVAQKTGTTGRVVSGNNLIALKSETPKKTDYHILVEYLPAINEIGLVRGKQNSEPSPKYKKYIDDLYNHLNISKSYAGGGLTYIDTEYDLESAEKRVEKLKKSGKYRRVQKRKNVYPTHTPSGKRSNRGSAGTFYRIWAEPKNKNYAGGGTLDEEYNYSRIDSFTDEDGNTIGLYWHTAYDHDEMVIAKNKQVLGYRYLLPHSKEQAKQDFQKMKERNEKLQRKNDLEDKFRSIAKSLDEQYKYEDKSVGLTFSENRELRKLIREVYNFKEGGSLDGQIEKMRADDIPITEGVVWEVVYSKYPTESEKGISEYNRLMKKHDKEITFHSRPYMNNGGMTRAELQSLSDRQLTDLKDENESEEHHLLEAIDNEDDKNTKAHYQRQHSQNRILYYKLKREFERRGLNMFSMAKGGALKPIPEGNKGLPKLPKEVRNKMGYMNHGGGIHPYDKVSQRYVNDTIKGIMKRKGQDYNAYSEYDLKYLKSFHSENDVAPSIYIKMWGLAIKHGWSGYNSKVLIYYSASGTILHYADNDMYSIDCVNPDNIDNSVARLTNYDKSNLRIQQDLQGYTGKYDLGLVPISKNAHSIMEVLGMRLSSGKLCIFACKESDMKNEELQNIINKDFDLIEAYMLPESSRNKVDCICVLKKK